jgi:DNA-binding transcriptional LysR family regulator
MLPALTQDGSQDINKNVRSTHKRDNSFRDPCAEALEDREPWPCVGVSAIDCNATYASLALARQGLGIAIVEPLTATGLPVQGVRQIPLAFDIPFRWSLITAVGRPLPSSVEAIIEHMRETKVQADRTIGDTAALT